ncbi:hypothetical protein Y032_0156g3117 [Ancylostoma ceylanicum]|uniref:Uncharacterized protein n=1 Tax=Ancylostoma ceylanicum TaxID=53326 RepID=A0A016SZ32_9BILA|nr:hypothetical protein Y032_0156g3117 [Ancylostoma ceylanicum]
MLTSVPAMSMENPTQTFRRLERRRTHPHSVDAGFQQVVLARAGILAEGADGAAKPAVSAHDAVFLQLVFFSPSPRGSRGVYKPADGFGNLVLLPLRRRADEPNGTCLAN